MMSENWLSMELYLWSFRFSPEKVVCSFDLRCLSKSDSILAKLWAPTATLVSNASLIETLSSRPSGDSEESAFSGNPIQRIRRNLCSPFRNIGWQPQIQTELTWQVMSRIAGNTNLSFWDNRLSVFITNVHGKVICSKVFLALTTREVQWQQWIVYILKWEREWMSKWGITAMLSLESWTHSIFRSNDQYNEIHTRMELLQEPAHSSWKDNKTTKTFF